MKISKFANCSDSMDGDQTPPSPPKVLYKYLRSFFFEMPRNLRQTVSWNQRKLLTGNSNFIPHHQPTKRPSIIIIYVNI